MYSGLVVLGFIFVLGCLPETRGLQLEDIETLFAGRLCSCGASSPGNSGNVQYIRVNGSNFIDTDTETDDASDFD